MTASSTTTNYHLSQFAGTDKPSFLTDYTADMSKIDAALHTATSGTTKPTAPADTALGLTASQYQRLWVDPDGIVRVKPAA